MRLEASTLGRRLKSHYLWEKVLLFSFSDHFPSAPQCRRGDDKKEGKAPKFVGCIDELWCFAHLFTRVSPRANAMVSPNVYSHLSATVNHPSARHRLPRHPKDALVLPDHSISTCVSLNFRGSAPQLGSSTGGCAPRLTMPLAPSVAQYTHPCSCGTFYARRPRGTTLWPSDTLLELPSLRSLHV